MNKNAVRLIKVAFVPVADNWTNMTQANFVAWYWSMKEIQGETG